MLIGCDIPGSSVTIRYRSSASSALTSFLPDTKLQTLSLKRLSSDMVADRRNMLDLLRSLKVGAVERGDNGAVYVHTHTHTHTHTLSLSLSLSLPLALSLTRSLAQGAVERGDNGAVYVHTHTHTHTHTQVLARLWTRQWTYGARC